MLSRPRTPQTRRPNRSCARIAVPDRLVRMTEFGLRHVAADSSGWWRRVELEMQALVSAHLPRAASDVRMELDPERLELVLEYAL